MPQWLRLALRWFWILLGTVMLAGQLMGLVAIGVFNTGHHLHQWMLWTVMTISFALVYTFARRVRRTT